MCTLPIRYLETSFVSRFKTVNSLSLATVRDNLVIVSFMSTVLGLLIFGCIWFLFVDYKFARSEAIKNEQLGAAGKPRVSLAVLQSRVIPHQFARRIWYKRYWETLKNEWSLMAFIYTRQGRDYRYYTLTWIFILGKLINFIFVGTLVAVLFFADDETCGKFDNENSCIDRLGLDLQHNLCIWNKEEEICTYNSYHTSVTATLIATLVIQVLVAPIDALLRHFLLMIKCLLVEREDKIRKEVASAAPHPGIRQVDAWPTTHNRSQSKVQQLQAKFILAARFAKMKTTIDNLDPYNELYVMLQMKLFRAQQACCTDIETKMQLQTTRDTVSDLLGDIPTISTKSTKTVTYKFLRAFSTASYVVDESLRNRPSYMSRKPNANVLSLDGDSRICKTSSED